MSIPAPAGALVLRPYQDDGAGAIEAGLADGGLGQLHAACGAGKTVIAVEAANRLTAAAPGSVTVVAVPSLLLCAQIIATWSAFAAEHTVLAVCSDEDVVDQAVHVDDVDAPVTTDPARIAAFLHLTGRRLLVVTYASAPAAAEAVRATGQHPDLLIVDEAHHLSGAPDTSIARLVDRTWLPARRTLYMTATPRAEARDGALSMDDIAAFGPVLYSYPFDRAIAEGWLKDYRLLVVGVTSAEAYRLLGTDGASRVGSAGGLDLETAVAQVALARARQKYDIRRVLSFHHRVDEAAEFAATVNVTYAQLPAAQRPAGALHTGHVNGKQDLDTRHRILEHLRTPPPGGWTVITNARCLGEGLDVPAVDAVLFARPKQSAVDIIQAVGRALRKDSGGATIATIIVPILIPAAEDTDEVGDLNPRNYQVLWDVLRALRAHDEPLGVALDMQREGRHGEAEDRLAKIVFEVGDDVARAALDQIRVLVVKQTTSPWWEGIGHARAFQTEHGHLRVPESYITADNYPLGKWLSAQRTYYRAGTLIRKRAELLTELGIAWDPLDARWQELLAHARTYRTEHGNLRVPTNYICADGYSLGRQLSHRRAQRRAGQLNPLWAADLDELGMPWEPVRTIFWKLHDRLAAFRREHGHLDIGLTYTAEDGYPLGARLAKQRQPSRVAAMQPAEHQALDALGPWQDPEQQPRQLTALVRRWRADHGEDSVIPADYTDPDTGLRPGAWLEDVGAGLVYQPAVRATELLPGSRKDQALWADRIARLTAHRDLHQTANVPMDYTDPDGVELGRWLVHTRTQWRRGRLSPGQISDLLALGVLRDPKTAKTQKMLEACDRFVARHGHLRVPAAYVDPEKVKLGAWIVFVRQLARGNSRGTLDSELRAELDARGMIWEARNAHVRKVTTASTGTERQPHRRTTNAPTAGP